MRIGPAAAVRAVLALRVAVLLLLAAAPAVHCGPAQGATPGWPSYSQDQEPSAGGATTPWHSVPAAPLLRRLQQTTCAPGTHRCGARCVSDADPRTCGKRCTPCPAPSSGNGAAACSAAGACGVTCSNGFARVRACSVGEACTTACRRVCPAGRQANARGTACAVCPDNTYKPSAGPAACRPCPAGTRTTGKRASDHDAAADCKVLLSCPAGQEADARGLSCRACGAGMYKDSAGPGPCTRCPPASSASGNKAEDHDSVQDCRPISCPPGKERDTVAGGCKVCADNHFKSKSGPRPCEACPPGSATLGDAAADHDEPSDCFIASCRPGQQANPSTGACVTCPADTIKAKAGPQACTACPEGTRTFGQLPADHDDVSDCLAGGLLPSGNLTGSFSLQEALDSFDMLFERSLNNSGKGRFGGRGTGSLKGRRTGACLYECSGGDDYDAVSSRAVAHLAGSPAAYRSDNPADVRAGVNLLGVVHQQGSCATCVSAVISSAATAAVAAALRVDGTSLAPLSHDYAYHCSYAWGDAGARRSCGFGWRFDEALRSMQSYPGAFFMNASCLDGADLTQLSYSSSQLAGGCNRAKSACGTAGFVCSYVALADGIWSVQRWLRTRGAVLVRIRINERFENFFRENATGVYEEPPPPSGAPPPPDEPYFWHAVLLTGYNNTGFFWYARNSWGSSWADGGTFRIAYGALGIGHPEETYGLECSPASNDTATRTAWSDPWPVTVELDAPGCHLYTATMRDTISGIADHFGVDILQLVEANTRRGIIPTELRGDPQRPEPQLDGPWTGKQFQLCGLQETDFGRVAAAACSSAPSGGNADWPATCSGRSAGSSCSGTCATGFTGSATATCAATGTWTISGCMQVAGEARTVRADGVDYIVHISPKLTWDAANERCQQDGMQLLRLYSRQHGVNVHAAVSQVTDESYWIGLSDAAAERSWVWSADGAAQSTTESNWIDLDPAADWRYSNHPLNHVGNEDCARARLIAGGNHQWVSVPCSLEHVFVCAPASITSACVRFPCLPPALCATSGSSIMPPGRTCFCGAGSEYGDDVIGCSSHTSRRIDIGDGVEYTLYTSPMLTWDRADYVCKARGTSLVKITSMEQANQLHAAVMNSRLGATPVSYLPEHDAAYWIGLNDRAIEGTYVWTSDGSRLSLQAPWRIGQPDNTIDVEHCIYTIQRSGAWADISCTYRAAYVCSNK